MPSIVRSEDRESFKSCRRAWDFGSSARQNLEPKSAKPAAGVEAALREALAVHYFPGMWSWQRDVVEPLAVAALRRVIDEPPDRVAAAEALLARYFAWARALDRFQPIRVATEFEVHVPDPRAAGPAAPPERSLVGPDGEAVRFRSVIDVLVQDEFEKYWLVEHRIGRRALAGPSELRLDEASAARCWAWESFFLGMEIRGTIFNQIRLDAENGEEFRRTELPRERSEIEARRAQTALEILDMFDPDVRIYPNPGPERCAVCDFRRPCVAMMEGADPGPFVVAEFRRRAELVTTPRLGRETWPSNRAAAPARLRPGEPIQ